MRSEATRTSHAGRARGPGLKTIAALLIMAVASSCTDGVGTLEAPLPSFNSLDARAIGDFVWHDLNRDGIQDPGEPGIPDVRLDLRQGLCSDASPVVTHRITDASGAYLFGTHPVSSFGDWCVEVDSSTLPPGFVPSPTGAGPDPSVDSNPSPYQVTLDVANPSDLTVDFGFHEDVPVGPCDECKGGVTSITLRYLGDPADQISFDIDSDESATQVGPGTWVIEGEPKDGALDKLGEFEILVNGEEHTSIHTSCSQPVDPGLVYGAFLIEAATSKDNGNVCPLGACSYETEAPDFDGDKFEWKIENTGTTSLAIQSIEIAWPASGGQLEKIKLDGDFYETDTDAPAAGDVLQLNESNWVGELKDRNIEPGDDDKLEIEFSGDVGQDLLLRVSFYGTDSSCVLELVPGAPPTGGLSCEAGDPQVLVMQYTGEDCSASDHGQGSDKVECSGDPGFAGPVHILAGDDDDPTDEDAGRWFVGEVTLGGSFSIDATADGEDELKSSTHVHIFDAGMQTVLQSLEFHTSCSQPLEVGDQFGSLILDQFFPRP